MNALRVYRPLGIYSLMAFASVLHVRVALADAPPQEGLVGQYTEPVVARVLMRFKVEGEVVDTIEKGALLTVLDQREDAYLVVTYRGKKGWVAKENVVALVDSVLIYDELLRGESSDARFYTLRAAAWWARGEATKALDDYGRAIELGYNEPHVYVSRGMFHAALGNYDEALEDYNTAIERGAEGASPYINRAAVYMSLKKYDLALGDYEEATRIDPAKASTYQQRGVARKLNGQLDEAVQEFGKAIELDPKFVPAWMSRGYVWYQLGEASKAIADFSEVIRLQPDAAQAYNNRGYNRQLMGDNHNALRDYDRAIELAPKYALAYQNKAWLLATCSDPKIRDGRRGIEAATKACELHNYENFADLKALAAAFAEDGQFDKAMGWQEKVIELVDEEHKPFEREILEKYQSHEALRFAGLEPVP